MTFRSKRLETLIEGKPIILIHDGKINYDALKGVQMTIHELKAALRAEDVLGKKRCGSPCWRTTAISP
jgi:uncharacterized membrane protein YcaP (DUF421 family)